MVNMRFVFLISSLVFIVSCGDKNKSEFMNGCTGGSSSDYAHEVCSCAYDKMKDNYGDPEEWESRLYKEGPDNLVSAMKSSIESCQ